MQKLVTDGFLVSGCMLKMVKSLTHYCSFNRSVEFFSPVYIFLEDIQQYPFFSQPPAPPLLSCMFLFILPSFTLHTYFDFAPSLRHLQVLWMSGGRSVGSDTAEMLMVSDYIHRSVRAAGTSPVAQSAVWVPEMEDRAHVLQADCTFEGLNCLVEDQTDLLHSCLPLPLQ